MADITIRTRSGIYIKGYDELLLPHLAEALNNNPGNRKLIVLHSTGSHGPVYSSWPRDKVVSKPLGIEKVCYDNPIHHTSSLLERVLTMLGTHRISAMYFSNHGLEYSPTEEYAYFHGGIKLSRQAYYVPMSIWYSPTLGRHVDRWTTNGILSAAYSDYLVNAWMGITRPVQPEVPEEVITH